MLKPGQDTPLIRVENLCKYFQLSSKETLKAVDHISFEIYKGETVGVVGESGCGKSTLGRCLVNLYEATGGDVYFKGVNLKKYRKQPLKKELCQNAQMIFQNPYASLNPRMTVKEIVGEGIKLYHRHITDAELEKQVLALLQRVELNKDHMSRFAHEFSGGQKQRIGIARALSVNPGFIVCDEPISALDVSIQAQVINMLKELQKEMGLTYLFIAHDLSVVKYISDRIIVMYVGNMAEYADAEELYRNPLHPYTRALLSAIPVADPDAADQRKEIPIEGEITSPINPKPGCRFAPRCPYAEEICKRETPERKEVIKGHYVSCHLY
jgi:oligopeptide/dipeptide ABC transporter ATP-binding protein